MFVLFPQDGSPPRAVAELPMSPSQRETKNLFFENGLTGTIRGLCRNDWTLYVAMTFLELDCLPLGSAPNPFYGGVVRGDIYVSVTMESYEDGDESACVSIKIPPLELAEAPDLARLLKQDGDRALYARRFWTDMPAGKMSADEVIALGAAQAGRPPPRLSGRELGIEPSRLFEASAQRQGAWELEIHSD